MIKEICIEIETDAFQKTLNEDKEITNPNMYGKALCEFLKTELGNSGYQVPFYCNEDWGWWIEVKCPEFNIGLQVYSRVDEQDKIDAYAIMSSITDEKKWIWSRFRYVSTEKPVRLLMKTLVNIFEKQNKDIRIKLHDDFPF